MLWSFLPPHGSGKHYEIMKKISGSTSTLQLSTSVTWASQLAFFSQHRLLPHTGVKLPPPAYLR